jgi:hypothetical protein
VAGAAAGVAAGAVATAIGHREEPGRRAGERDVHEPRADDPLSRLDAQDLEDLTDLLYGRVRTRLRRELLIDRERAGLLTDFR